MVGAGDEGWWRPGAAIAAVGGVACAAAAVSPWPDALGGWVIGGVLLVAALTSLARRRPR